MNKGKKSGRRLIATILLGALFIPQADCEAGDIAYGQYLSSECVTCHQISGHSDGIPSIVGWPTESFKSVLNSYRLKDRPHPVMQAIAGRLSDEDVEALAEYFASLSGMTQ